MTIYTKFGFTVAALTVALGACAEPESPPDATTRAAPAATDVFSTDSRNQPLPADQVFFPDIFVEDDGSVTLGFRMLSGYYIYRDKIGVRSLTDGVTLGEPDLPSGEIVVDDWFGEQQVYYNDMMAKVPVSRTANDAISVDVEVSWQGCKENELCYMPVSKVVTVELAAQVDSAAQ